MESKKVSNKVSKSGKFTVTCICLDTKSLSYDQEFDESIKKTQTFTWLLQQMENISIQKHRKKWGTVFFGINKIPKKQVEKEIQTQEQENKCTIQGYLNYLPIYFTLSEEKLISLNIKYCRNQRQMEFPETTTIMQAIIEFFNQNQLSHEGICTFSDNITCFDPNKTLQASRFKDKQTIYIVGDDEITGQECGVSFPDLSQKALFIKLSYDGPKWRTVKAGLNVLGYCENKDCPSYNKIQNKSSEVVCMLGFQTFDLIKSNKSVKCPECSIHFKVNQCGFLNCLYKWSGIYIDEKGEEQKVSGQGTATGEFKYYSGDKKIKFNNFTISCESKSKDYLQQYAQLQPSQEIQLSKSQCVICCDETIISQESDDKVYDNCGHQCHNQCFEELSQSQLLKSDVQICPSCRY